MYITGLRKKYDKFRKNHQSKSSNDILIPAHTQSVKKWRMAIIRGLASFRIKLAINRADLSSLNSPNMSVCT